MITIYAEQKSERLRYALHIVLRTVLGIDFRVVTDWESFNNLELPRINYSHRQSEHCISIVPHTLLFEKNIRKQKIKLRQWRKQPCFFVTEKKSLIPFDIFAASFYLITRYEEYLDFKADDHGRFPAKESVAYKEGFLKKPVVNIWAQLLLVQIQQHYPYYQINHSRFRFISTIDVDMAFSYKNKGLLRILGGYTRELLNLDLKKIEKRTRVLTGQDRDPFDNFDYQLELHQQFETEVKYFILLADPGKFDKNNDYDNEEFVDIVQKLSSYHEVGIHPSYNSNKKKKMVREEINRLEAILLADVSSSRQHFLKFNIRETYKTLVKNSIREDHTMGYSEVTGFRAGICIPYQFFDLEENQSIPLVVYPFAVMDVALMRFMKLKPEEAIAEISSLVEEVQQVKGTFISVFHNESLSDIDNWQGWRHVYEKMLSLAVASNDKVLQTS